MESGLQQVMFEDTGQPITPVSAAVDRHSISVPGARGDSVMTGGMGEPWGRVFKHMVWEGSQGM